MYMLSKEPSFAIKNIELYQDDALEFLYLVNPKSVDLILTSPPLLETGYLAEVYSEFRRIIKDAGSIWINFKELTSQNGVILTEIVNGIIKGCTYQDAVVVDPFLGNGLTAKLCKILNRKFIGCDQNGMILRKVFGELECL